MSYAAPIQSPPCLRLPVPENLDWTRIQNLLNQISRRICPSWPIEKRQDFVQLALLKVMELEHRRPGQTIWTPIYLSRLVRSLLIDEIRRCSRRPEEQLDETIAEGIPAAETTDPERACLGQELGRALRKGLAALSPARREACLLHLSGYDSREIATRLGWQNKKVENAIYRGLADLRASLATRGFVPGDTWRHVATRQDVFNRTKVAAHGQSNLA